VLFRSPQNPKTPSQSLIDLNTYIFMVVVPFSIRLTCT